MYEREGAGIAGKSGRLSPAVYQKYFDTAQPITAEELNRIDRQLDAQYRLRWAGQESKRLLAAGRLSPNEAGEMVANVARLDQKRGPPALLGPERSRAATGRGDGSRGRAEAEKARAASWGLLGEIGLNRWLLPIDDATRSPFAPYGLPGIMLGAAIVFFAYIGFDSISTHAEEARNPQRDVPIGILVSLLLCTVLYIAVASVVTGMVPYHDIDVKAPIAEAFTAGRGGPHSFMLHVATGLVAAGGLAGMTSVLLVLFLSQARIFMAMARDGLLPPVFGRGPSAVPHAPRGHHRHRRGDLPGGGLHADLDAGRDGQHRHALGFRHGLRGGAGAPHSRPDGAASFPLPDDLPRGPAGNHDQPDLDPVPAHGHLAAAGRLAGDRAGDLRPLRPAAQPGQPSSDARDHGPARSRRSTPRPRRSRG